MSIDIQQLEKHCPVLRGHCYRMLGPAVDAKDSVQETMIRAWRAVKLGYPSGVVMGLGLIQLALLALYLVPRTAVLGTVLWSGYLGGAIATHVRIGNPLFSHVLFPIYVAGFLWLRDRQMRAVLPFESVMPGGGGVAG